jgi:tRNA pseudouridine13 synthase
VGGVNIKQRVGDFRVRELLASDYLVESGEHRVYRVTKRKLTTQKAVAILAEEAGVERREVGIAGFKDRQAISTQYMSVPGGRPVRVQTGEIRIEFVGFAREPLTSEKSQGNAFELTVRGLSRPDVTLLRTNLPLVREHGLVDYFDDQRFGNLTHGQGWVAKELMLGRPEEALKMLLASRNPSDDDAHRRFKDEVLRDWGDWRACRDHAGRLGEYHSVFEHLAKQPDDFSGAFARVATRLRLIHLFAWQSHLWNRAVADRLRTLLPLQERVLLDCVEGPLVSHAGPLPRALADRPRFPLPGERLEGIDEPEDVALYTAVLAREGMTPAELAVVPEIPGFVLKAELRELVVVPRHLRVRPPEPDTLARGAMQVRVRFELPRGSYASLVVKRLLARPHGQVEPHEPERGPTGGHGRGRGHGQGQGQRRDRARGPRGPHGPHESGRSGR